MKHVAIALVLTFAAAVFSPAFGSACGLSCPAGAFIEGEPPCGPGYEDHHNGGCGSLPVAFQHIDPNYEETYYICGESGTYDDFYRDTDWYELTVESQSTVTFCATAEFPLLILFMDGRLGCPNPDMVMSSASADSCQQACLMETVEPGTYWLWVSPSVFWSIPCGAPYVATVDVSYGPTPASVASWGTVKALYR